MGYLDSFCISFYDKFKDLLASNNENLPTSSENSNLKQSIASEIKSLSMSKVSSQNLDLTDITNLKKGSLT